MSKTVYVVSGSEDGLLGVYGNVKAAYSVAREYVEGSYTKTKVVLSYKKACEELRNYHTVVELADYSAPVNATITSIGYNVDEGPYKTIAYPGYCRPGREEKS